MDSQALLREDPVPTRPTHARAWPGLLVWGLTWGLMILAHEALGLGNLALMLVLASALGGLWLGSAPSLALGVASVGAFNWLFVPPRFTFHVQLQQDLLLLLATLSVSTIVGLLMTRLRRVAATESVRARHVSDLARLAGRLRESESREALPGIFLAELTRVTGASCAVLMDGPSPREALPDAARVLWAGDPDGIERAGLVAMRSESGPLGPGTGRRETLPALYLTLRSGPRSVGAALVREARSMVASGEVHHLQEMADLFGKEVEHFEAVRVAQTATATLGEQRIRTTLLAAIAHDFRTPLATIAGAASAVQDQLERLTPEQIREHLRAVIEETRALNRVTAHTLQLARLDASASRLETQWESLDEILAASLSRARRGFPGRQLTLELAPALPLVRCDPLLIGLLIDNLLDNALRYSPNGSPIRIDALIRTGHIVLRVMDEGPGIPASQRGEIFEPFRRLGTVANGEADTAPEPGGRRGFGLGLAVCRAVARVHAFRLWVEDGPPHGSHFCLEIPILEQPSCPAEDPDRESVE